MCGGARAGIVEGQREATGAPSPSPAPGSKARALLRTWSCSPTSTMVISPTISIQPVPQGLCELTPLRNHTWKAGVKRLPGFSKAQEEQRHKLPLWFRPHLSTRSLQTGPVQPWASSPHCCRLSRWAWHRPTGLRVTCRPPRPSSESQEVGGGGTYCISNPDSEL